MIGIYMFINKKTKEVYVGQSIDIQRRYKEHLKSQDTTLFHSALRKYGIENFDFKVVEECLESELNEKECYWIKFYNSFQNGYNMTQGGSGIKNLLNKEIVQELNLDAEDTFMLSWKDYTAAAKDLAPAALKLFMYLAKNQDGYVFWFSSKDYCNTFDLADSTFRKAKKELLEKGYLKEKENNQVYFNTKAAFKETIESLKKDFTQIGEQLKIEDEKSYHELLEETQKKNLKEIKDEVLYKIAIKELIALGEEMLKEVASKEINNLL